MTMERFRHICTKFHRCQEVDLLCDLEARGSLQCPSSNGEAEHMVQTINGLMNKTADPFLALLVHKDWFFILSSSQDISSAHTSQWFPTLLFQSYPITKNSKPGMLLQRRNRGTATINGTAPFICLLWWLEKCGSRTCNVQCGSETEKIYTRNTYRHLATKLSPSCDSAHTTERQADEGHSAKRTHPDSADNPTATTSLENKVDSTKACLSIRSNKSWPVMDTAFVHPRI